MVESLMELARRETSGERALALVNRIVSCHRIQSSPGFREAVKLCEEAARSWGLKTEIHNFRADGETSYWGCTIPREWEATAATLELILPERKKLADFAESKLSLIQRSISAKIDSAEIVALNDGLEKEEYRDTDVSGKLVLTKGNLSRVHELAVEEFGALGIIFDGVREVKPVRSRATLPDALQYTSFWWRPEDKKCFGFVITPRQGDWLRGLIASSTGAKTPVRARANVESTFRDGSMEVLSCFIPGECLEEILLIAHVCHPQPSANDNASGCAAVLEAMRTIKTLLDRHEVRPLKRGIRALLLAEMTGSIAYVAGNEERLRDFVCGLNVDMVGENQGLCGSTFMLESPPDACRGFSRELGSSILERLFKGEPTMGGTGRIFQERTGARPFSGGSDHVILTDPDVGVPCPSLCQWPDRFYHTSLDTPDKVDPAMLKAAATLSVSYALFSATAGAKEARWLANEMFTDLKLTVTNEIRNRLGRAFGKEILGAETEHSAINELSGLRKKLSYLLERSKDATEQLGHLGLSEKELAEYREDANEWVRREFSEAEKNFLRLPARPGAAFVHPDSARSRPEDSAGLRESDRLERLVPSRVLRGPSGHGTVAEHFWVRLPKEDREQFWQATRENEGTPRVFQNLAWCWVNGKRSLREIAELVEMESDFRNDVFLESYFLALEKAGLVRMLKRGPSDARERNDETDKSGVG